MKVSVLIVTFNSESVIRECLDSLMVQDYDDFEILIYDNASSDRTCEIAEKYRGSKIRLIKGRFNKGFGFALNRLAELASGEIIASLNPDTVAENEWIKNAVRHFGGDDVGMVSSRVHFRDNPGLLDSAGHLIYPDGLNRGRGHNQLFSDRYGVVEDVIFPSGSAGFYRKKLYLELGGIDESLFLFGDDTDIGLKIQLYGYRCIYEPLSVVYHHYSHSTGRYSDIKAYFAERNRLHILLKYFPTGLIIKSLYYTLKRVIFHNMSALFRKGSTAGYLKEGSLYRLYLLMLMAYGDVIAELPSIIEKRRRLSGVIDIKRMNELVRRYSISAREIALTD